MSPIRQVVTDVGAYPGCRGACLVSWTKFISNTYHLLLSRLEGEIMSSSDDKVERLKVQTSLFYYISFQLDIFHVFLSALHISQKALHGQFFGGLHQPGDMDVERGPSLVLEIFFWTLILKAWCFWLKCPPLYFHSLPSVFTQCEQQLYLRRFYLHVATTHTTQ